MVQRYEVIEDNWFSGRVQVEYTDLNIAIRQAKKYKSEVIDLETGEVLFSTVK